MQSWNITKNKTIELIQTEQQDVNLREFARVKIARASLCASDIAIYNGKLGELPIVPSRSALGVISESKDKALSKGQRVYLSPYIKKENELYDVKGRNLDGYLSDFAVVPVDNVYIVPESIPDESFTFIEEIAMAIKTCSLLKIKPTQYITLIGATAFNMILGQFALYYQAIPIIIDKSDAALEIAEQHGIYYTINTEKENVTDRIVEITSGNLTENLIIDVDIIRDLDQDILSIVSQNGKIGFVGYNTSLGKMPIDSHFIISKRLSIYGINDGIGEIESAINMLATDVVKVEDLLDKMYDFSEVNTVFKKLASSPIRLKTIIRC